MSRPGLRGRPDGLDRRLGVELKLAREAAGWTRERLARGLGVSPQQLQKYEAGADRMAAAMLVRAAEALGTPAAALMPSKERAAPPPRGAGELMRLFACMPAHARRATLRFARLAGRALAVLAAGLLVAPPAAAQERGAVCVRLRDLGIDAGDPALRPLDGAPERAVLGLVDRAPRGAEALIATAPPFDVATVFVLHRGCVLKARHLTLEELVAMSLGQYTPP